MKVDQSKRNMMLTQPIPKIIPQMALPTIIAYLINSVYSLADTYFVSSIGTNATAAVSVNSSLDMVIMLGGSCMAVGAASYISRLMGAGDDEKASRVLSTAFFLASGLGLLVLILGSVFMTPLVRLLGATPTCEKYSIQYATYLLLAAPFMTANFVMNQCLRAEGSATRSMLGMSFGGVLNCFLDPIFIRVLGLGVAGASMATAISKLVSFIILIYPYITQRSTLTLSVHYFKPNRIMMREVITIGSSSMFRSLCSVLASIVLNKLAGEISDSVLAGIGVCTKVMMFPFSIILGFGTGFQPVAGFNYGAKRYDRVRESFRFSEIVALAGGAILGIVIWIFSRTVISVFAGDDPEMTQIGMLCMRAQCAALPIHAGVMVINSFCAGLGRAKSAFALSISRQGLFFFPVVFLFSFLWGATGLALTQAVADVLTIILAIPLLLILLNELATTEKLTNEESV